MAHTYVFPAHAGMSRPRFILAPAFVVFPAHAGMSLCPGTRRDHGEGFPRPRGDEPSVGRAPHFFALFSPPTRG